MLLCGDAYVRNEIKILILILIQQPASLIITTIIIEYRSLSSSVLKEIDEAPELRFNQHKMLQRLHNVIREQLPHVHF